MLLYQGLVLRLLYRLQRVQPVRGSNIIEGIQTDTMALPDEVLPEGKNGMSGKNNAELKPKGEIILSKD